MADARYKKVHLGCGSKHIPGWFHVDALKYPHVDHVGRVEDLSFIPDNSVELIYACHVLEHFGRKTYQAALAEWFRVLAPGGVLRLAVPDFEAGAKLYLAGKSPGGLVTGGQRDPYDFHGMIFDCASLSATLLALGFARVEAWDWRKTEHAAMDDYSQAYIPHMDKEKGTLVSLNLEATKPR
jgi:predicted SAM-dependent methyltransferase